MEGRFLLRRSFFLFFVRRSGRIVCQIAWNPRGQVMSLLEFTFLSILYSGVSKGVRSTDLHLEVALQMAMA